MSSRGHCRLLFWSEAIGQRHHVMRSSTKGEGAVELVERSRPIAGMCLWRSRNGQSRIMWIENTSGSLLSCDYDGNDVKVMYQYNANVASYVAVAVFQVGIVCVCFFYNIVVNKPQL